LSLNAFHKRNENAAKTALANLQKVAKKVKANRFFKSVSFFGFIFVILSQLIYFKHTLNTDAAIKSYFLGY
jgi:hypothetical protein